MADPNYSGSTLEQIAAWLSGQTGIASDRLLAGANRYDQKWGTTARDHDWWGVEAKKRAIIQGYNEIAPAAPIDLNRFWNQQTELQQQGQIKVIGESDQATHGGGGFFDSLLPVLAVAGLAYGGYSLLAGAGEAAAATAATEATASAVAAGSNFAPSTLAAFGPSGASTLAAFDAATSTAMTTSVADYAAAAVASGGTAATLTPFAASLPLATIGSSAAAGFSVLDALRTVESGAKATAAVINATTAGKATAQQYLTAKPSASPAPSFTFPGATAMETPRGNPMPGATPQNIIPPNTGASPLPVIVLAGLVLLYVMG